MKLRPTLLGIAGLSSLLSAQTPSPNDVPQFEAATIKINVSGELRGQVSAPPGTGRLTITNSRVSELLQSAHGLQLPSLLLNTPDWARSLRVDVVAKADAPAPLSVLQRMLLPLFAESMKLTTHRETREMDVFALVVSNGNGRLGPKLKKSDADCGDALGTTIQFNRGTPATPGGPLCGVQPSDGPGHIKATGVDIAAIAALLAPSQQRPVVDRTNLTGRYDIDLTYTPEAFSAAALAGRNGTPLPGVDPNGPSLVSALEQQAGLKLQSTRAPVEVVVIDQIERPSN